MQNDKKVAPDVGDVIVNPWNYDNLFPKIELVNKYNRKIEANTLFSKSNQNVLYGNGHNAFMRKDCKNNIFFISDSNNRFFPVFEEYYNICKNDDDKKKKKTLNNTMIVSIGTELSSGYGNCFYNALYNSFFFIAKDYKYSNKLVEFIKNNKQKMQTAEYLKEKFPYRKFPEMDRGNGYFYLRITYNENGNINERVLDLLEYKYCVDYVKTTESMKFINAFTKRYKERFKKEPEIGTLKLPLQDYVNFFYEDKHNNALVSTASMLLLYDWKKNNKFQKEGIQKRIKDIEDEFCNKNFDFNKLLSKIIINNKLKITKSEFNEIFKEHFKAETNIEKMFVLAEKSEELKKEIERFTEIKYDPYGYMQKLEKEYGQMRRQEFRTKKITDIYKGMINKKIDYSKVKSKAFADINKQKVKS